MLSGPLASLDAHAGRLFNIAHNPASEWSVVKDKDKPNDKEWLSGQQAETHAGRLFYIAQDPASEWPVVRNNDKDKTVLKTPQIATPETKTNTSTMTRTRTRA